MKEKLKERSLQSQFAVFRRYFKKNWQLYIIFTLPAFALTVVFKYIPIGGIMLAFEDYSPLGGLFGSTWIGFQNFNRFLSSPEFWNLLFNTLKLSVYGLLWGFMPPVIIALLLSHIVRPGLRKKIQLVLYAPNFISVIVLVGMLFVFFSPVGPVNQIMGSSINYMSEPGDFRSLYIGSGIWQGAGWASVIYTATLANVSLELVEAARIDGASLFQQIRYVELPALKPIMVIQFILSAGQIMNIGFEKALAMQTDLNKATSEIIATYVYKIGLQVGDYGYSTAVGLFNSVINLILLIFVNTIVKKLNDGQGL